MDASTDTSRVVTLPGKSLQTSVKADQVMTTMYKRISQPKRAEASKTFVPI